MNNKLTVIKIGSKVLVGENGQLHISLLEQILLLIGGRVKQGEKIVLITSGAVALGKTFFEKKKLDKKLAAGMGQMELMAYYFWAAKKIGVSVSELLLSRPHLLQRQHFLQLQTSIESAFENGIIPVVNENDALVYGTSWSFGDNDSLAASLAIAFSADKLLILSHVDGLYQVDPIINKQSVLINRVDNVNAELMRLCSKNTSASGRGGMISKLKAARLCTAVGIETQIINGLKIDQLGDALQEKSVGTIFSARSQKKIVSNRGRWILAARNSAASIEIDSGALFALKKGKSLLAVGITNIFGSFEKGELVEVINEDKEGVAIGLVDVDSKKLEKIKFKLQKGVQVVHADNLMVFV